MMKSKKETGNGMGKLSQSRFQFLYLKGYVLFIINAVSLLTLLSKFPSAHF